ncbi:MAG: hypothetical protein M5U25_11330 [Planctomycetota bacterium]|nr:hypothetical protein [Planctomycetota bacterium]
MGEPHRANGLACASLRCLFFSSNPFSENRHDDCDRAGMACAAPGICLGRHWRALLQRRAADYTDEVVDVRDLRMDQEDGSLAVSSARYPLQAHALTQLGSKLGIPAGCLQRCIPSFAPRTSTGWLEQEGGDVFLRFDRLEVRAIFSTPATAPGQPRSGQRYARRPTRELAPAL